MPKVSTTVEGLSLRIGNHGVATFCTPCEVPEKVAQELKNHKRLRVVEGKPPEAPRLRTPKKTKEKEG